MLLADYNGTSSSQFVLGVGKMRLPGGASTLRILNGSTDVESQTGTFSHTQDNLGRDVTVCSPAGSVMTGISDAYFYGLGGTDALRGAGIESPFGTGFLHGAGDVLLWALTRHSTVKVDRARIAQHSNHLNQYKVDTWINKPINTWAWIESALLRWLPVEVRQSAEGIWFQPIRWDYTETDVVAVLDANGRTVQRVSSVQSLRQPVYNEITVRCRPGRGSSWLAQRTLTSQSGQLSQIRTETSNIVADDRILPSFIARSSQRVFGVRPLTIDIAQTWQVGTALLVAQSAIGRYAWPKRTMSYQASQQFEALAIGSVVALTDADLHLSGQLAFVYDRVDGGAGVRLDLILLDSPVTRAASTD